MMRFTAMPSIAVTNGFIMNGGILDNGPEIGFGQGENLVYVYVPINVYRLNDK